MEEKIIEFKEFISPPEVDFLSGRKFGEKIYKNLNISQDIKSNNIKYKIFIDEKIVKGINDSFIKGFFSDVFSKLKTKDKVYKKFEIIAIDHYKNLFEKNFRILEAVQ